MSAIRAIGGTQRGVERARIGDGQDAGAKAPNSSPGFSALLEAAASASDAPADQQTAATFTTASERLGLPVHSSPQQPDTEVDSTTPPSPDLTQTPPALDPGPVVGDHAPLGQHASRSSQDRVADLSADLGETPLGSDFESTDAASPGRPDASIGTQRPLGGSFHRNARRDPIATPGAAGASAAPLGDLTSTSAIPELDGEAGVDGHTHPAESHSTDSETMPDRVDAPHAPPLSSPGDPGDGVNERSVMAPGQDDKWHRSSHLNNSPEIVQVGAVSALQVSGYVLQAPADDARNSLAMAATAVGDPRLVGVVSGNRPEAINPGDPASSPTPSTSVVSEPAPNQSDLASRQVIVSPAADGFSGLREFNPSSEMAMRFPSKATLPGPDADVNLATPHSNARGEDAPPSTFPAPIAIGPSLDTLANTALAANPQGGLPVNLTASSLPLTDLAGNLSYHVKILADNGASQVVLRLHPPELGDLTVRILVTGRDVSAWFASPHIQVQQTISSAIGQLHTDLGNAGYNLNGAWVGADAGGSGERERSSATRQQQHNATGRTSTDESRDLPALSASSRVSVYV